MDRAPTELQHAPAPRRDLGAAGVLISFVVSAASVCLALTASDAGHKVSARPWMFAGFVVVTAGLQLVTLDVYGRGAFSFSGTGLLALGFVFGPGAAMAAAVVIGTINAVRRRALLHRGIFDAAQMTLAAGAGSGLYLVIGSAGWPPVARIIPAVIAGGLYMAVQVGLLSLVMSLTEGTGPLELWRERFRWMTPYFLVSGPLALAVTIAYQKTGIVGLFAFALPPAFRMISVRQYLARTRQSVEEVQRASEDLRLANEDLRELLEFAAGLAPRAHDKHALADYAERALSRLTGGRARVMLDPDADGIGLVAGGSRVGAVSFEENGGFEAARWDRLAEAILPQLATAAESAELVERVRKTHLATIAALSRSMEAKDFYTGGHTERVAAIALALASRLGYAGADLAAIEIGALLHDIGKIGIPERILHKPGPLDPEEWKVIRQHPVISEYILSEVDLHPIVRQIARSSHERIDGLGYPDALAGDEIPLPARIVLVADAFDAVTSDRPYRRGRHTLAALDELRKGAGTQFCPRVIAALERVFREEPQLLASAPRLRPVAVA